MNPIFTFSVPSPCREDWDKMNEAEKGRHCALCNKVVRDFTGSTNQEIARSYAESKGELCGRFLSSQFSQSNFTFQLSRSYFQQLRDFCFALLMAFGASLFFFKTAQARNFVSKIQEGISAQVDSLQKSDSILIIKGRITDKDNNEGISFASIQLSEGETHLGAATADIDGNFQISVDRNRITNIGLVMLTTRAVGYVPTVTKNIIKKNAGPKVIDIVLPIEVSTVTFGIVIRTYCPPLTDPFYPGHKTISREEWRRMPK